MADPRVSQERVHEVAFSSNRKRMEVSYSTCPIEDKPCHLALVMVEVPCLPICVTVTLIEGQQIASINVRHGHVLFWGRCGADLAGEKKRLSLKVHWRLSWNTVRSSSAAETPPRP